jgi:Family of unknown function (DUF5906)
MTRDNLASIEAARARLDAEAAAVTVRDFYAYMPMHHYIFVPTRELWPPSSVIARCEPPRDASGQPVTKPVPRKGKDGKLEFEDVPVPATEWLDEHHPVDQMTWSPTDPLVIPDRLVSGGGWIERRGCFCFNLYRPPDLLHGDAGAAGPWLDHIGRVFPEHVDHIVSWLAHRVQRPGEKINHGLVLAGEPGIGKDSILEPLRYAVGPWNFAEVSPAQLLGRFNGFIKSVILRVSEARDLGDVDRYAFYEHMKVLTAAPPEVLRCDEKNLREHAVLNVTGVIITSNHKTDGIYLPADDRRHYVCWSEATAKDFSADYFNTLHAWYSAGGIGHAAAYLAQLDLTGFDPKAPPPKTPAFWDIVDANRAPEDSELADVIEALGNPPAITLNMITSGNATLDYAFQMWLQDRRNRRLIPHRMEAAGYAPVRNDADKHDGQWKVAGKRQTIYARRELSVRDRLAAAVALCRLR